MLFKDITIIDPDFRPVEHAYVGVRDDVIAYVGLCAPREDFGETYDGKNRLLLPAFYDLHSHLSMALMRGYGEDLPLSEWLNHKIFPFEAKLTEQDMYFGALMGMAEMFRFGIGAASDMYLSQKAVCRAFLDSGAKGNVSRCVTCFDDSDYHDLPYYREALESIDEFDGADRGRVKAEFSLHAEYTSNEKIARAVAEEAKKHGSSMHVHAAETQAETEACRARHGKSPIKYLADCGIFDVPTVAAHCVYIDGQDVEILREKHVTVAADPKSNLKLASGFSPAGVFLKAGVSVGIGTDSVASNNNLNMIEEMRFFNLLQKGLNGDPTSITPRETLYAATRAGALAQGRPDGGLIKEGFKADLTVLDTDKIYMLPVHDLLANVVYSAQGTDVVLTMVDGRVVYRDGQYPTLDIDRIIYECEKARVRILGELAQDKRRTNA